MRVAIIGSKYHSNLEKLNYFRVVVKEVMGDLNIDLDDSYFNSTCDEDKQDLNSVYRKIEKIISRADFVIVESSTYSTGIGVIIGRAIEMKKPTLVLFKSEENKKPSIIVRAYENNSRYFYKEYTDDVLRSVILNFVREAKKSLNTKFLFNLTPEMSRYLQWASNYYNRSMVDILRELVDKEINSNKEWTKISRIL